MPYRRALLPKPKLLVAEQWKLALRPLNLSGRHSDILLLLLQGKKDKQIARDLGITLNTVRTHMKRVFARFGVADRQELVLILFGTCLAACGAAKCPYKM
jgi:DNA-binding NarL/FixJ family response regulator